MELFKTDLGANSFDNASDYNDAVNSGGSGKSTFGALWSIIAMIGSYVVKTIVGLRSSQTSYQNVITKVLYEKSLDSGKGVCPFLIDATHQQNFKEAILAYFFIWQGKAESIDELDCECEDFLEGLGDTVDFEVSDAVEKLTRDGLLLTDGPIAMNTCVRLAGQNLSTLPHLHLHLHSLLSAPPPLACT